MEIKQEDYFLADEQVSIWAVRRKLFVAYFITFSLLFVLVSGIAAWLTYAPIIDARDAS